MKLPEEDDGYCSNSPSLDSPQPLKLEPQGNTHETPKKTTSVENVPKKMVKLTTMCKSPLTTNSVSSKFFISQLNKTLKVTSPTNTVTKPIIKKPRISEELLDEEVCGSSARTGQPYQRRWQCGWVGAGWRSTGWCHGRQETHPIVDHDYCSFSAYNAEIQSSIIIMTTDSNGKSDKLGMRKSGASIGDYGVKRGMVGRPRNIRNQTVIHKPHLQTNKNFTKSPNNDKSYVKIPGSFQDDFVYFATTRGRIPRKRTSENNIPQPLTTATTTINSTPNNCLNTFAWYKTMATTDKSSRFGTNKHHIRGRKPQQKPATTPHSPPPSTTPLDEPPSISTTLSHTLTTPIKHQTTDPNDSSLSLLDQLKMPDEQAGPEMSELDVVDLVMQMLPPDSYSTTTPPSLQQLTLSIENGKNEFLEEMTEFLSSADMPASSSGISPPHSKSTPPFNLDDLPSINHEEEKSDEFEESIETMLTDQSHNTEGSNEIDIMGDSVPELTTVNMYWNELPGLVIGGVQYVRLVDMHKQMLPSKDTAILKKRCCMMGLQHTLCSDIQRDFLIRYMNAAKSRSRVCVSKDVALALVDFYVGSKAKLSCLQDVPQIQTYPSLSPSNPLLKPGPQYAYQLNTSLPATPSKEECSKSDEGIKRSARLRHKRISYLDLLNNGVDHNKTPLKLTDVSNDENNFSNDEEKKKKIENVYLKHYTHKRVNEERRSNGRIVLKETNGDPHKMMFEVNSKGFTQEGREAALKRGAVMKKINDRQNRLNKNNRTNSFKI